MVSKIFYLKFKIILSTVFDLLLIYYHLPGTEFASK